MRSCNPWFFEIGWTLYGNDEYSLIADMARGFGLGSPTGLQELPEAAGQITNPDQSTTGSDPVFNAVQQAIGQSDTLISPLQAVVYAAAVGNGGNLLQPQLTERIVDTGGTIIQSFEPIVTGTLPVSEETLFAIQSAMRMVVNNPRGTAYRTFANMTTPIYGKTGTAQNPGELAHAWFIGYTNAGREDLPDIAIVVMIENIGDGSEFAAPIFRRMVEVYFTGIPQRRYPWELQIGVFDEEYFLPPEEEGDEGGGAVELTPSP
jgi:penicillin-binding protein 2